MGLLPAEGLDFITEVSIRVTCKDHDTVVVGDAVIWVCGDVVE